ncbi:hypothetical protein ES705_08696 [subsurface metagenome]
MIEPTVLMSSLVSSEFIKFINKYINGIRKARGKKRVEEAQKTLNATIEQLSEKQAEGITFEHIYVNLLDGKIDNKQAIEILSSLGYKINPNPIWNCPYKTEHSSTLSISFIYSLGDIIFKPLCG